MFIKHLVWFTLLARASFEMIEILRPKTVRVYKLTGTCPGRENAPIYFEDIHVSLVNRITIVSLKVIATKDIPGNIKVVLTLERCPSREALDSCEKYQTVQIKHLCGLINSRNKPWTPFVDIADPPVGCPLRKGVHVIRNGTFDGSAFANLPISGYYWIITAEVIGEADNSEILCITMQAQVVPV